MGYLGGERVREEWGGGWYLHAREVEVNRTSATATWLTPPIPNENQRKRLWHFSSTIHTRSSGAFTFLMKNLIQTEVLR